VDLSGVQHLPRHDLASSLVYATSGSEVRWSWVAGKPLVSEGKLQTLDYTDLTARAERWSEQLGAFRQTLEL
jgi:5-methylthioadenosine/S-adenosylhomocysteine deaminase